MAAKIVISNPHVAEIEIAASNIQRGLLAIKEIAATGEVTLETLAATCDHMTTAMLIDVRKLLDIVDARTRHG